VGIDGVFEILHKKGLGTYITGLAPTVLLPKKMLLALDARRRTMTAEPSFMF
jgi:hypothetical protein